MPENSSRFKVPKSPTRNIYQITKWLGCDFTSSPSAVDEFHSQECINFTRYMPGKIRKRMGYERVTYTTNLIDIWKWNDDCYLFHDSYYVYAIWRNKTTGEFDFSPIGSNDNYAVFTYGAHVKHVFGAKSLSFVKQGDIGLIFGEGVFVYIKWQNPGYVTGGNFMAYSSGSYFDDFCYIPTVTISKKPKGGGVSFQPFNMVLNGFTESFYVSQNDAEEREFHLSYGHIQSVLAVQIMDENGSWVDVPPSGSQSFGAQCYTCDDVNGIFTFYLPPGVSPVEGEDNVRISVMSSDIEAQYDKLAYCRFSITYGVGGKPDRIFMSGNNDYPNYDWYSEIDDITYFPDTNYSVLGNDSSKINGYAIVSNYLVTIKGKGTDQQVAIIREGVLDNDGNAVFTVVKSLQGYPILAPRTSIMAGIEPLFLSTEGIMAITADDISGEQMMNSRSYFLNGKLMKESHLENAFAIRNGDFYMLFVNSHVYVLDTLQPITTDNTPYSTREYATFYWDNIRANCAASIDGVVYFGNGSGLFKQYTDENSISSYSDNGDAIHCKYVTADLDALIFFKLKTYRYFALKVFSAVASSVKISCYRNGEWELLKDDAGTVRYFTFSQLVFSKLTFRTDLGTRIVNSKVRLKKLDHVKFMIENDQLEEALMIDEFGVEFTQSGNYKN